MKYLIPLSILLLASCQTAKFSYRDHTNGKGMITYSNRGFSFALEKRHAKALELIANECKPLAGRIVNETTKEIVIGEHVDVDLAAGTADSSNRTEERVYIQYSCI